MALAGVGIVIGITISYINWLTNKATEQKERLAAVEKEQLEMKLLLKQILKRLKIPS
ncbi:hypothetical protein HYU16_01725 [Candidatus Woesearchaeota archaeon]|nr:hypothetical protein [Candidatus Woesearchaeota archaeon]